MGKEWRIDMQIKELKRKMLCACLFMRSVINRSNNDLPGKIKMGKSQICNVKK